MSFGMMIAFGFFFVAVFRFALKMHTKHKNSPVPMIDLGWIVVFAIMLITGVFLGV